MIRVNLSGNPRGLVGLLFQMKPMYVRGGRSHYIVFLDNPFYRRNMLVYNDTMALVTSADLNRARYYMCVRSVDFGDYFGLLGVCGWNIWYVWGRYRVRTSDGSSAGD